MSSSLKPSQNQPPPPRLRGRVFLALILVQLLTGGAGLLVSNHLHAVYHAILSSHEQIHVQRNRVDQLLDRLQRFGAVANASAGWRKNEAADLARQARVAPAVLGTAELDVGGMHPEDAEEMRAAAADLNDKAGLLVQPEQQEAPSYRRLALVQQAAQRFDVSLEQLDEDSYSRLYGLQRIRVAKNIVEALALILLLFAAVYGVRLQGQARAHELGKLSIEVRLQGERDALEKRVEVRTAELRAEVRERRRVEDLNKGRNRALEMLARNQPTTDILRVLVETVAEYHSTWMCSLHLLEDGLLKLVATGKTDHKLAAHLRNIATDFADAPESAALAGEALFFIEHLDREQKPWSALLVANGVQSVWSAPFFAPDSTALGTLTVYSRLKYKLTSSDLELMETTCHMAALVAEHRRLHAQLVDHAYHDSLTGLPNRRLGEDRLAGATGRAVRSGNPFAVLWIDLDKFKQVNDVYGHAAGDAVLQQVASRLSGRLRGSDTLARMGGDEFMAILEGIPDRETAERTGTELLAVLDEPIVMGEVKLCVGASIGVSLFPEDGTTAELLERNADQAMYEAKFGGHGVRSFSPSISREQEERRDLELELRRALDEERFTVAYQPLCLPDGTLVSFEALLRFEHPRLGSIPPSVFIPIAEEAQMIVPLGTWVLREACRQGQRWKTAGHPAIPIAVNISALQFMREDFADTVAGILAETGHPPNLLELELTESIVMKDFDESAEQMTRLKNLGVRIAIDDFGTGYSSLSYLHLLPIDVLKIDRSFVALLDLPDGTRPIVGAILSMAHTLGLSVVAEGVETAQQRSTLHNDGCDVLQGFYFARPVAAAEAAGLMLRGNLDPALAGGGEAVTAQA